VTGGPAMWHDAWSYRGRGSRRPIEARQWWRRAAVRIGEVLCVGEIEGGGGQYGRGPVVLGRPDEHDPL
jgi:hypothetical protein